MLCSSNFVDDVMFSRDRAYVMYGKIYGREISVSERQHREGWSWQYTVEFGCGGKQCIVHGGQYNNYCCRYYFHIYT